MIRSALALAFSLFVVPAQAQSVTQSGSVTNGHAAYWVSNGVIGDAGTSASPKITSLGIVNNGGPALCVDSALPTSAGYNQLCLSASTTGGSKISAYAFGAATNPGITFDINGSVQGFPAVTLPVTSGHGACFSGTTGLLIDCGAPPLPATLSNNNIFIGNASNVAIGAPMTGDCSIALVSTNVVIRCPGYNSVVTYGAVMNDPTKATANGVALTAACAATGSAYVPAGILYLNGVYTIPSTCGDVGGAGQGVSILQQPSGQGTLDNSFLRVVSTSAFRIHDLTLNSGYLSGNVGHEVIEITGASQVTLENIEIAAGNRGVEINISSYVYLTNVWVSAYSNRAISGDSPSNHVYITNPRIDPVNTTRVPDSKDQGISLSGCQTCEVRGGYINMPGTWGILFGYDAINNPTFRPNGIVVDGVQIITNQVEPIGVQDGYNLTIANNQLIGNPNSLDNGIGLYANDGGTSSTLTANRIVVSGNNVVNMGANAIVINIAGFASNVSITGNTVTNPAMYPPQFLANGITILSSQASGAVNINVTGNTVIDNYASTSSSSAVPIAGTGAKTFTTPTGQIWIAGDTLRLADEANPANFNTGTVTSYSGTTLVMNITAVAGSGTPASWLIGHARTMIAEDTSDTSGTFFANNNIQGNTTKGGWYGPALRNGVIVSGATSRATSGGTLIQGYGDTRRGGKLINNAGTNYWQWWMDPSTSAYFLENKTGNSFSVDTAGNIGVVADIYMRNNHFTAASGSNVWTMPSITATILGDTTANTVTNKSMSGSANTFTNIPNSALVNASTTVNGQTCTLGSTCTITASATSVTIGSTTVAGGTTGRPLYDNAGVLGEYATVPVAFGGTNCTAASGTCLDNITSFASTGFVTRTGAGAYAFQSTTNGITLGNMAQAAANSVIANCTASTANVTNVQAGAADQVFRVGAGANPCAFGAIDLSKSAAVGASILGAANGGTGLSALGTGIATFLATPSSANLATAVTDETGSGPLVFGTSSTLTTPTLSGIVTLSSSANISSGPGFSFLSGTTFLFAGGTSGYIFNNQASNSNLMIISNVGAVSLPQLASTSAAQTGTVCWATGGNLTVDTTTTCLLSSARFKHDIQPLRDALSTTLALKPVSYEYNEMIAGEQIGFIAEDVAQVDDRLISRDPDGSPRSVRYQQLTAVLAGAIQQLKADNDDLLARIAVLEKSRRRASSQ